MISEIIEKLNSPITTLHLIYGLIGYLSYKWIVFTFSMFKKIIKNMLE
jgi:hypothetical protein